MVLEAKRLSHIGEFKDLNLVLIEEGVDDERIREGAEEGRGEDDSD